MMSLLFSSAYRESAVPFKIYALSLPLRSAVYGSILMATQRTQWVTISAIVGLVCNTLLNVVFVRWFGASGAAWASTLTTYVVIGFMLFPLSQALEIQVRELIDWSHISKVLFASIIPALPFFWLSSLFQTTDLIKILCLGSLYMSSVLGIYYQMKLTTLQELHAFLRKKGNQN